MLSSKIFDDIDEDDIDSVQKLLLANKNQIDKHSTFGHTMLTYSADRGKLAIVSLLLNLGASIKKTDVNGDTALITAADQGNLKIVRLLLNHDASIVNFKNAYKDTALHKAARNGHEEIASLLLDKKAEIDAQDDLLATPLILATAFGHKNVVALLINRRANLDLKNVVNKSALDLAKWHEFSDIVTLLGEAKIIGSTNKIKLQIASSIHHAQSLTETPSQDPMQTFKSKLLEMKSYDYSIKRLKNGFEVKCIKPCELSKEIVLKLENLAQSFKSVLANEGILEKKDYQMEIKDQLCKIIVEQKILESNHNILDNIAELLERAGYSNTWDSYFLDDFCPTKATLYPEPKEDDELHDVDFDAPITCRIQ